MESNASARLRWRPMVRPRKTPVIGPPGGGPAGCWAATTAGKANDMASDRSAARDFLMGVLRGGGTAGCEMMDVRRMRRNRRSRVRFRLDQPSWIGLGFGDALHSSA